MLPSYSVHTNCSACTLLSNLYKWLALVAAASSACAARIKPSGSVSSLPTLALAFVLPTVCFAHVVCAGAYADLDVVTTALRSASNAVKNNNDNKARV